MKLLAFGLILICCHAWATEIDDNFLVRGVHAHKIEKLLLEKFKSTLRYGKGISIPDPYTTPMLIWKYNQSDIDVDAIFTNFTIEGLSSYKVNSFACNPFVSKAHMNVTWPMIIVNATRYTVSNTSKIFGYNIYGDGKMNATTYNCTFTANLSYVLKGGHIQIKTMASNLFIPKIDLSATGLMYQDDERSALTSKNISEMAPEMISQKQNMMAINEMMKEEINGYLSTIPVKDLLKSFT